ncbi:MAG TPA: helix-turn-helix domain-containing protein, partial [Chloroflexota bacterium]
MHALSPDLRIRIVAAVDAGTPKAEVARRFAVSLSSVKRLVVLRRERGSLVPLPRPGRTPTIRPDDEEALWAQLVAHPT